jgi:hypothetical protein
MGALRLEPLKFVDIVERDPETTVPKDLGTFGVEPSTLTISDVDAEVQKDGLEDTEPNNA